MWQNGEHHASKDSSPRSKVDGKPSTPRSQARPRNTHAQTQHRTAAAVRCIAARRAAHQGLNTTHITPAAQRGRGQRHGGGQTRASRSRSAKPDSATRRRADTSKPIALSQARLRNTQAAATGPAGFALQGGEPGAEQHCTKGTQCHRRAIRAT
eukprot:275344-Prymnesium_polylepis.2